MQAVFLATTHTSWQHGFLSLGWDVLKLELCALSGPVCTLALLGLLGCVGQPRRREPGGNSGATGEDTPSSARQRTDRQAVGSVGVVYSKAVHSYPGTLGEVVYVGTKKVATSVGVDGFRRSPAGSVLSWVPRVGRCKCLRWVGT